MKHTVLILCLLMAGCGHKKTQSAPAPQLPPPVAETPKPAKPQPRPLRAGDYILKNVEVLPDGTVACHKPIQVIDSTKKHEDVTVYRCR